MTDFIIEDHQQCMSNKWGDHNIGGYVQFGLFGTNTYPQCSCPEYKHGEKIVNFGGKMYPKPCVHILLANEKGCSWHSFWGIPQTKDQEEGMICPECGFDTENVQIGV